MPKIAELRVIDDELWARVGVPEDDFESGVALWSPDDVARERNRVLELAAQDCEDRLTFSHCRTDAAAVIRALKQPLVSSDEAQTTMFADAAPHPHDTKAPGLAGLVTRDEYDEIVADPEQEYTRCPNAMNGEHRWHDYTGKNASKPLSCVYCTKLEIDLRKDEDDG